MRWLSNVSGLYVIVCIYCLFNSLLLEKKSPSRDERIVLSSWFLTAGVMAACLWLAHIPEVSDVIAYGNPALVAYRLSYLTFFVAVLVRLMLMARRLIHAAGDLIAYLSLKGFVIGSYWAFGYCASTLALDLAPRHARWLGMLVFANHLCICITALIYIGAYSLYIWAKHVRLVLWVRQARLLLSYYRLRPLWATYMQSVTSPMAFHLAPPWYEVIFRPDRTLFLIDRLVIEILDSHRLLGMAGQTGDSAELVGSGTNLLDLPTQLALHAETPREMRQAAAFAAVTLAHQIYHDPLATKQYRRLVEESPSFVPTTYADLVLYLERVALALRFWRWRYWLSGESIHVWYLRRWKQREREKQHVRQRRQPTV